MKKRKTIAICDLCGDRLYDGDTAYRMEDAYYCPGCVTSSMVICRDDDYYEYPHEKSIREDD
jgi:hypothetical protein